jgi:hypothetical protein
METVRGGIALKLKIALGALALVASFAAQGFMPRDAFA